MSILFLQYPPCSTCKRARKWLDDHGISYEARHIKEQNPTAAELETWYKKSGLPLKKFFNTSGNLYKEQNLKDRLPEMTEAEQLELLATGRLLWGKILFWLGLRKWSGKTLFNSWLYSFYY